MIKIMSIFLVLIATFIGAIGTSLIKKGTNKYEFKELLTTIYLWDGLFLYGISALIYIFALKKENLSTLYPLASMTYIWVVFFSVKYLKEKMNYMKWISLIMIILGVVMIGIGG